MNTQRQGILTDCETKQSQKGNIYHRMDIKEHGADRATWYTYFGNLDASHRGQEIRYVLKESRDGTPIVDSYELAEPGMAPPPQAAAPQPGPQYTAPQPAGHVNRHGGSKDMWICTESIFQHSCMATDTPEDIQELALTAASCAILINSAFRVHDKDGSTKALAFLRKALPGEPAALAADLAAKAMTERRGVDHAGREIVTRVIAGDEAGEIAADILKQRAAEAVPPPRVDIVPPAPGWQPAPTPPARPDDPPVEAYDDIPGFDNDDIPF